MRSVTPRRSREHPQPRRAERRNHSGAAEAATERDSPEQPSPSRQRTEHTSRRGLSREAIVAVARRIADAEGLAELTLRRVAGELDTGQASLYRHIRDRAELLTLLADDLAGGYPLLPEDRDPLQTVTNQWLAMYRYLTEHSWGPPVISGGGYRSGAALPITRHCLAQLHKLGLDERDARRTYRALWPLLMGHLLNKHPFGHGTGAAEATQNPGEEDFRWAVHRLLAGAAGWRHD